MTAWVLATDVQSWIGADKLTLDAAGALAQVASDAVQGLVQRNIALQTVTDILDTNGTDYVLLHYWPVRSIASVTLNGLPVQPAAFQSPGWIMDSFNPRKLLFSGMGKQYRGALNVTVTGLVAGYDFTLEPGGGANAPPGDLQQALLLTAAAIFNSQAADPNLVSEETAGVFSGSFHAAGVGSVPPGARTLLRPYIPVNP
jgi:hypothetical protein